MDGLLDEVIGNKIELAAYRFLLEPDRYSHMPFVCDPTEVFWIIDMSKGYGKIRSRIDTRLPITLFILRCNRFLPYAQVSIT